MLPLALSLTYAENALRLAIANPSQSPVSLWSPSYSFGHDSVSFQVRPLKGKPCSIKKIARRWTVNIPGSLAIQPGDTYLQTFHLNDGTWDTSLCGDVDPRTEIEISAVLEIAQDDNAVTYGIVTGRYESNRLRFKSMKEIVN
jgi:hypothetical protein